MRNQETGEFELVVGNRQLLSGFFIVVLLFAVAFAMGYVVGQNSPRSAKLAAEAASGSSTPLSASDSRPQPASPAPVAEAAPAQQPETGSQPSGAADNPRQPTTQPARDSDAPPAPPPPDLPNGSYWQVMAVPQADAEVVIRALKDKGFPSMMSQGPNNLMRVLVGPYNDMQSFGKAKTELENAGFHPIRKQ
jgi:cell division septation protein DedD